MPSAYSELWKAEPASVAVKLSRGQWRRAPHLDLLSWKLTEMRERPLRLLVSIPPRHGKSELISYWTPVWFLANWPESPVMLASYEAGFAASWGRKVRNVIQEEQGLLGIQVKDDSSAVAAWQLAQGGGMVTAGVGGPITGRGAKLLLVDDPVKNWEEAHSPVYREKTWDWWRSTAYTRKEPGASIVVVMARWHRDDLIGRLLRDDADKWEYVALPAVAGAQDPLGRREGEPLWPERYNREALSAIQHDVGEEAWLSLYQQRPEEVSGDCFFDTLRLREMAKDARDGEVFKRYVVGRRYVAAIDPAGEGTDRHSLTIRDCQTGENVVVKAVRGAGSDFGLDAYNTLESYQFPLLQIEPNGVGLAMVNIMLGLGYPRNRFVYADAEQAAKRGETPQKVGMPSTGGRREEILAAYANSIHEGATVLYGRDEIEEHLNFMRNPNGKPAAMAGGHDDMVMSGAWANWVARQAPATSNVRLRSLVYGKA